MAEKMTPVSGEEVKNAEHKKYAKMSEPVEADKPPVEPPVFDMQALKEQIKAELRHEQEAEEAAAEAARISAEGEEERNAEAYLNEPVTVRLFKDGRDYKDPLTIHINGKGYAIQRGIPVTVPRKIALIIEQHERQDVAAAEYIAEQTSEFQEQARRFNI